MSDQTWFIGSRRHYGVTSRRERLQRLDPADFREPTTGSASDIARSREYELEVLERVIADIRDPKPDTTIG